MKCWPKCCLGTRTSRRRIHSERSAQTGRFQPRIAESNRDVEDRDRQGDWANPSGAALLAGRRRPYGAVRVLLERCPSASTSDMAAIAAAARHNSPGLPHANNRQSVAHPQNPRGLALVGANGSSSVGVPSDSTNGPPCDSPITRPLQESDL